MKFFGNALICILLLSTSGGYALGNGKTNHARSASSAECPSTNFRSFFDAFSERIEIQKVFTRYPLTTMHLNLEATPEPKPVYRSLSKTQIKFPVMPGAAERHSKSLMFRIDRLTPYRAKVTLIKSDTGYQVSYFFTRASCWNLYRIEDWSL